MTPSKWRPLPTFPDLPALLVSPAFNVETSSYSLEVTDLAHIWTESLDRKGILKRSLNEDTSIDLSDGDKEQWRFFLAKLDAAFDPTSVDHELTSLALSPHGTGDLLLHITCVLPKPLEPLKWPVNLTKREPDVLASDLVVPLIRASQVQAQEADYLVERLKEKDIVINRLVDKLQAVGTGLEHVFHSLPIKRKATRAMAEEKVPGLASFNEHQWRLHCASTLKTYLDIPTLLQDTQSHGGIGDGREDIQVSALVNDWWKAFKPTSALSKPKEQAVSAEERPSTPGKDEQDMHSDDDFQVHATQATPPSARKSQDRKKAVVHDGDTTDEDDGLTQIPDSHPVVAEHPRPKLGMLGGGRKASSQVQSQSQSSHTAANHDDTDSESEDEPAKPNQVNKPLPTPIGTIGGNEQSSPPAAKSPSPAPPSAQDDNETESDSDSDSAPRSSPGPSQPSQRIGRLGQIGGRSRATPAPADEEARATSAESGTPQRARQRLGTIGRSTGADAKGAQDESSVEPAEDEADREKRKVEMRRAELAKERERKAAAPAKKKRRF